MATPKTGNPVGCPPMYKTVDEMQPLIDSYFELVKPNVTFDKAGRAYNLNRNFPTVLGLCIHLGICDRSVLMDYQNKPEFTNAIVMAKQKIEQMTVEAGSWDGASNARFIEFNLRCNYGYVPAEKEQQAPPAEQVIRIIRDRGGKRG